MHKVKAQSAIEYLMTYGWMLIALAVISGVIFSLIGEQNVKKVNGFSGDDVEVVDFGITSEDELELVLRNSGSSSTTVNSVNVTQEARYSAWVGTLNLAVGEFGVIRVANVSESMGAEELDVGVSYDQGDLTNLGVSGSLTGGLEVTEPVTIINNTENQEGKGVGEVSEPSIGGEWSLVEPAGAKGGYNYFYESNSAYGDTNVEYRDAGFYIMKYRASNNGSDVPVSTGGAGWDEISFNYNSSRSYPGTDPGAVEACERLNDQTSSYHVHLTTNREWMTAARQIAQNSSNWADGIVGSSGSAGGLYQGNHDGGDSYVRAIDLGSSPEPVSSGGEEQRTHVLASGDIIWDMSGGLWEWVDAEEDGIPIATADGSKIYERDPAGTEVGDRDSNHQKGLGADFDFYDGDAAQRGGDWFYGGGGGYAGAFAATSGPAFEQDPSSGFRCSAVPIS